MKTIIKSILAASIAMITLQTNAKISHLLPTPRNITIYDNIEPIVVGSELRIESPIPSHIEAAKIIFDMPVSDNPDATTIKIVVSEEYSNEGDYELYGYEFEGYSLDIDEDGINITSRSAVGATRGLQTLAQLMEGWDDGIKRVEACHIDDYPAFKLRGYMHDVGRSFIPFEELKKQLILFSRFKVNTFHFHLTENQAWRFEVKAFPQLTSEASMTRFIGQYYTQEQCKELDQLASTLGMVIIPEIDMPGHSDAFERAMGHPMQTAAGINELKTILEEVADAFPNAPYIHIGADETTITYPNFLKTMTDKIHSLNKKVVVWNPASGVNISASTGVDMTQMWSSAGKKIAGIPNIDCRYNYINHFDLFADLVGIYKSNIYYQEKGDKEVAGTITAVWNDRNLSSSEEIMKQNNVYACVLASAERAWKGGGEQYIEQGGTTLPLSGDIAEEFNNWEERFLFHKDNVLKDEPIAYVKQSNVRWTITDPFPNNGNKNAVFPPETEGIQQGYTYNGVQYGTYEAAGAGIYLRHTWGTIVPAFYENPAINHTAYAWTYVYSPREQEVGALIEFQNYGRSEKDLAPENGQWDRKGSRIWVNDNEIIAPDWTNAGMTITNESLLGNENCSARKPSVFTLKEGWNKIFMKLPYVAANGVRLNKWMFTFVITDTQGENALEGLIYDNEEPTGISLPFVKNNTDEQRIYTLNGQQLTSGIDATTAGIYIIGNEQGYKKVVVK